MKHDPSDPDLEVKVQFHDDAHPIADWMSTADVFVDDGKCDCSHCVPEPPDDEENFLLIPFSD